MKNQGFTLLEIVVVVILIAIIAAFALPNFDKAIRKAHERDAIAQLYTIQGANKIYYARYQTYLQDTGTPLAIDAINSGLGINIISNGMTFSYDSTSATAYSATAQWSTAPTFTVKITEAAISTSAAPYNPCCLNPGGTNDCPSLRNC